MFKNISELSLWEISHYWHGEQPDSTKASALPIKVEATLRTLAGGSSRALYFRCPPTSIYCSAFTDSKLAVEMMTRAFQRELLRAYRHRRYNKKFLDGLTISRTALAKWCKKSNTEFPEFWFPPDDPLREKSLSELDDISALSKSGELVLFSMSRKNYIDVSFGEGLETSSQNMDDFPTQKKAVDEVIRQMAKNNAHAKYRNLYKVKQDFIRYFLSHNFKTKSHAAGSFYCTLTEQEKLDLVPSMGSALPGADSSEEKATRTLLTALREYKSGKPYPWLEGFTLRQ